ncbi:hypothetical protein EFP00_02025 [Lactiplantibacillus paraplantarum]|nr:hypothetical protein [Lactiplantibacillus paraplantarum]
MLNKTINIIKKYPVRSLFVALIVVFTNYVISDLSIISSFNQGLSDGTAGR